MNAPSRREACRDGSRMGVPESHVLDGPPTHLSSRGKLARLEAVRSGCSPGLDKREQRVY